MKNAEHAIRILSPAEADMAEIILYIVEENPTSADALANRIEQAFVLLARNPLMGREVQDEEIAELGYRYLLIGRYLAFYTVENHTVYVHRIVHGARDYLSLLQ